MTDKTTNSRKRGAATGKRAVTVTDIARAVGVPWATVSRVLRQSPLVNAKTREKVEAELKRQNHVCNRSAANLFLRQSLQLQSLGDVLRPASKQPPSPRVRNR